MEYIFIIELIAQCRKPLEIKQSGSKYYIRIPATISSRLNSIRPHGKSSGKGNLGNGRIERNIPKRLRKKPK